MRQLLFSMLLLSFTLPVVAEGQSSWWKFWQQSVDSVNTATQKTVNSTVFNSDERAILNDYLRKHVQLERHDDYSDDDYGKDKKHKDKKKKALPPGLQKKVERGGELPPGWQKKVAKGEVMDKDLYLASQGLPQDIIDRLPNAPAGTTIRRIDDRVVRVMEATGVILDVLVAGK